MKPLRMIVIAPLLLLTSVASAGGVEATIYPGGTMSWGGGGDMKYHCEKLSSEDLEFLIDRFDKTRELIIWFLNPAGQCSRVFNWDGSFQAKIYPREDILVETQPSGKVDVSYRDGPVEYNGAETLNLDFLRPGDDREEAIDEWVQKMQDERVFFGNVIGDGGQTNLDVLLTYSGVIYMGKYTGKFFFQAPFIDDLKESNGEWKEGWENAPAIFSKFLLEPFRND